MISFKTPRLFLPALITVVLAFAARAYDPVKEQVVYVIPGAHLDDQWLWTLDKTIDTYIPNTFNQNFALFQQYPEYKFSFEGAWRYWLIKTKYPTAWNTLKNYVAQGRWCLSGGGADPGDVNIPSAEGMIRNYLYGELFFMDEFGKKSIDVYLPDCFGFGYALPTIAAHCGIKGFSTQKFDQWGGSFPTPFPIGRWIGVDGSSVYSYLKCGAYDNGLDLRTADGDWIKTRAGFWATCDYIGTGDVGGAMDANKASTMINRIRANGSNTVKVYCTSTDQIFRDIDSLNLGGALPTYDGEMLMTTHGTGCYTSWAKMKYKHRKNEQRAEAAEFASVVANWLSNGSYAYPQSQIYSGWWRLSALTFHDVLTGTSLTDAYKIWAIPMEDSCFNEFTQAFTTSNTSVAQQLNTNVSEAGRIPLVLVNPLTASRCDVVEATVNFGVAAPAGVKVYNPEGTEVPAQIKSVSGQNVTILFIAKMPSASYAVYEVKPVTAANPADPTLTVNASTGVLENAFYKVTVNANGDISSIIAKTVKGGQELLQAPSRFELRDNVGVNFPAWEVSWTNVSSSPKGYVDQTVVKTVQETGPARVSLKITRSKNNSTFTHYITLAADSAGARIDVDNTVNWYTAATLLKASFPLTCSNPNATWDIGIGTVSRGNMFLNSSTQKGLYEVCGQHWADLTATDGSYGVSVLNDCKYGWNKPNDNTLNLTLLHSPSGTGFGYEYACDLSSNTTVGQHNFKYSVYGHTGTWTNGTVTQGERVNQPIFAYQSTAHAGVQGKAFSFVRTSTPQVDVMAIKKAEKSSSYIVRVRETTGNPVTGARLTFPMAAITAASEVNGLEEAKGTAQFAGSDLIFNLTKYQPKTFALTLGTPVAVNRKFEDLLHPKITERTVSVVMSSARNIHVSLRIPAEATIRGVSINDAAGRLVQKLATPGDASQALVWDGRDMYSRLIGKGVYFVTIATDRGRCFARLPVVQ